MNLFREIAIFRSERFSFGMVFLTSHPTSWTYGLAEEIICLSLKGAATIVCRRASPFKAQALKPSIPISRQPLVRVPRQTRGRNRRKLGESTTQVVKVAAHRSKLIIVTIQLGVARHKAFQIFFGADGSLFVTFPYFKHRTGILAAATIAGNGLTTSQVNLEASGKIASHLVKYSHHSDGHAHFSQDGRVRTEIKRQSIALNAQRGHIFSVLIQGLQAFEKADDTKDVGSSARRTVLTFQIAVAPGVEALKLIGRWLDVSTLLPVGPTPTTVGPTVPTQDPTGRQQNGFLVASPHDKVPQNVLLITCEPIPRLGPEPEIMLFYGGFDSREIMDDTSRDAGFLTFLYPASDAEDLKKRLGTIDR